MADSILDSVKKVLNIPLDDTAFDQDVILHINSVLANLEQLGIGPQGGYMITDKTNDWNDILANDFRLNNVKTYVCLQVRRLFDPPQSGYALTAMKEQIEEYAWRINVTREGDEWERPSSLSQP